MGQIMSIDTDKVASAVNQINELVGEIQKKNTEGIALLEAANQKTENKFSLLTTLETRIREEAGNLNKLASSSDVITEALNRYADMASEANDDSAFRV